MSKNFIPVNELLQQTTLDQFVTHYNFSTEIKQKGQEERIRSPFPCEKCRGNGLAVSVNWGAGVFTSHCYHCDTRGRVTTLLYGMKHGQKPASNPLKGTEFKEIANDIAIVAGYGNANEPVVASKPQTPATSSPKSPTPETKVNVPLYRHPDERVQALEYLDDQFVTDPTDLNARANAYLGLRPYLTQDVMEEWNVGFLPSNSKSMLRSRLVYCLKNEKGQKLGWVGRDLAFEEKLRKWEQSDRTKAAPVKTKFPPGFARGSFLYGAEIKRLDQPGAREQVAKTGVVVTEGFNDCIALATHGIVSVSLCSNRIAEGQIEKLVRWSNELAGGKVTLFLDNDPEGFEGAKQVMEKLGDQVHVRTAWTPDSSGGKFRGKQPEQLSREEIRELLGF